MPHEQTCRANFHMPKGQLEGIVELMHGTGFDRARERHGYERSRTGNMTAKATIAQDTPSARVQGRGVRVHPLSGRLRQDECRYVASVGESTLRGWLVCFADAVRTKMKPLYMSGKPFSDEERKAIRDEFAVRAVGCGGPSMRAMGRTHHSTP